MKKLLIFTILFSLLSFQVYSLTTDSFDFPRYQSTRQNTGQSLGVFGYWDAQGASTPTSITASIGTSYAPIAVDLDNDGIREFIVHDGSTLYFYNLVGGLLFVKGQTSLLGTQQGSYSVIYDYNSNGLNELVAVHNNTIYVYEINQTVSLITSSQMPSTPFSSIYCDSEQLVQDDILCWYADNNNSVVEWDLESFVLNVIDSTENDDASDGIFESSVIVAGQNSNNDIFETSFLFRNMTSGTIDGLTFKLNSIVGSPQTAGFVYDFAVCPTTSQEITGTASLYGDCDGAITNLQTNMDLSNALSSYVAGDIVYLPFSSPYTIDSNYNYLFQLDYNYHNYTNNNDYWTVYADLTGTENTYRQRNIPSSNATQSNQTVNIYHWSNADDSDGVTDNKKEFVGFENDKYFDWQTIVTMKQSGVINKIQFDIAEVKNIPHTRNLIYDIYICPTTISSFGTSSIFAECSSPQTLIKDNVNISDVFGATTGLKSISLDSDFAVTSASKYIIIMNYVSGTLGGGDDNYLITTDSNPTNDLMKLWHEGILENRFAEIPSIIFSGLNTSGGDTLLSALPQVNSTTQTNQDYNIYNTGFSHGLFSVHMANKYRPAFSDIDKITYKLGFLAQTSSGEEGVYIWDTSSKSAYTPFSIDGLKGITTTDSFDKMRGIMFADRGNGGFEEIVTTHFTRDGNWQRGFIEITNADGSYYVREEVGSNSLSSDPEVFITPPFITNINGTDYFCAISAWSSLGNEESNILCRQDYNPTVASSYENQTQTLYYSSNGENKNALSINLAGTSTNVDNIIAPTGILEFDNSGFIKTYDFSQYGYNIFADINGDDNVDICNIDNADTICFFSTLENNIPELENLEYGGYWTSEAIGESVCVNSVYTISAFECLGSQTNCNYQNDITTDTERLATNCGINSNPEQELEYGSFSLSSPSVSCVFNETGFYTITVYIQDNKNPTDLTEYNIQQIPVNVIEGEVGETCNFGNFETSEDRENSTVQAGEQEQEEIDQILNSVVGTSWVTRLLIALIIIGGFMFIGAKQKNNVVTVISTVIGLTVSIIFGLISLWFALFVGALSLIIIILLAMLGQKASG